MNNEFISKVLGKPFSACPEHYCLNSFFLKEIWHYNNNCQLLNCNTHCFEDEKSYSSGEVDISIMIKSEGDMLEVSFDNLLVPSWLNDKGIGTTLMQSVFNNVRSLKNYYGIKNEVLVTGKLSKYDNNKTFWGRSIPFYEKTGQLMGIKTRFQIVNTNMTVESSEKFFAEVGDSDGKVIYYI